MTRATFCSLVLFAACGGRETPRPVEVRDPSFDVFELATAWRIRCPITQGPGSVGCEVYDVRGEAFAEARSMLVESSYRVLTNAEALALVGKKLERDECVPVLLRCVKAESDGLSPLAPDLCTVSWDAGDVQVYHCAYRTRFTRLRAEPVVALLPGTPKSVCVDHATAIYSE